MPCTNQTNVDQIFITDLYFVCFSIIKLYIEELHNVQKDGVLTEENILERANKVINRLRDCNVLLRWISLHAIPLGTYINYYH